VSKSGWIINPVRIVSYQWTGHFVRETECPDEECEAPKRYLI
jgi:hypothetical protein